MRGQFRINVLHPRRGNFSKPEIQKEIGKKFNITDTQKIFIYGFCTYGQRFSGLGLIYDKLEDAIRYVPNHRSLKNEIHDFETNTKKITKKREQKICGLMQRKKKLFSHTFHP